LLFFNSVSFSFFLLTRATRTMAVTENVMPIPILCSMLILLSFNLLTYLTNDPKILSYDITVTIMLMAMRQNRETEGISKLLEILRFIILSCFTEKQVSATDMLNCREVIHIGMIDKIKFISSTCVAVANYHLFNICVSETVPSSWCLTTAPLSRNLQTSQILVS